MSGSGDELGARAWDEGELSRAAELARALRAAGVGSEKLFAVRAPGRVNLIGEHTDYSGLPVLPMAIDRSTIIVAAPRDSDEIELRNADPAYPPRRFRLEPRIAAYSAGDWANYVKAAAQGVITHFTARGQVRFRGAVLAIDGRVPPGAGLSSSAALTVASALTIMALSGLELGPIEAATMIARSEWYVGTMAGGMDQAASLMGRAGHALHIEFDPLRVRPVRMPAQAAVVVADSREPADKSGRARGEYNRRVIECALAARLIARALGLETAAPSLGAVVRRVKRFDPDQLLAALQSIAPERVGADLTFAAGLLGTSAPELARALPGGAPAVSALDQSRPLEIFRRARHVLSETQRVKSAVAMLEAGRLDEMGALMDESHRSLERDFEVSTARLDKMVECARRGGALGARLTGAGFGGSIIALCRAVDAKTAIAELDRGYFQRLAGGDETARAIVRAGDGAGVIEVSAV